MSGWIWNLIAPVYAGIRNLPGLSGITDREYRSLAALLEAVPEEKRGRLLDLGTGAGSVFVELNGSTDSLLVGVDRSRKMTDAAKRRFPDGFYVHADATQLPFRAETFDLVVCVGLCEYVKDLKTLMGNIEAVLVPGGFAIITLSPPSALNRARLLAGHRLYLRTKPDLKASLAGSRLAVIRSLETKTQIQFLLSMTRTPGPMRSE